MNPFDIINSISSTKARVISAENEKDYNAFMVNRGLSYFPDTILLAQEMNVNHHLDRLLQYDYLMNTVRQKKRFSKWAKREKSELLDAVMKYYNYGYRKAQEAISTLKKEELDHIMKVMTAGID